MILFAILVCMMPAAAFAPSSFSASGSGAGGDGDDQKKKSKLPNTHALDADPLYFKEDDNTEDDEKVAGPNATAASNPEVRSSAWWQRYPHLPYKCSLCFKHFRSIKALNGHMMKALHNNWHSKRERKSNNSSVIPDPVLYPRADREKADHPVNSVSGLEMATEFRRYQCDVRLKELSSTEQAFSGNRSSEHKKQKVDFSKAKGGIVSTNAGAETKSAVTSSAPPSSSSAKHSAISAGQELSADMECDDRSGGGRGLRKIKMFDLNHLPPPEPNSEVHDNGDKDDYAK